MLAIVVLIIAAIVHAAVTSLASRLQAVRRPHHVRRRHTAASKIQAHTRRFALLRRLFFFNALLIQRAWRARRASDSSTEPHNNPDACAGGSGRPTTAVVDETDATGDAPPPPVESAAAKDEPPPLIALVQDAHGALQLGGQAKPIVDPPRPKDVKGGRRRGAGRSKAAVEESRRKVAAAQEDLPPGSQPGSEAYPLHPLAPGASDFVVLNILRNMAPMADFPSDKCAALRRMITADMLLLTVLNLRLIVEALIAELMVFHQHRERHPGGSTTALARYLCDYLKRVVAKNKLILARDNTYKQFASFVNAHLRAVVEDEMLTELQWELNDDEPAIPDDHLAAASPMGTHAPLDEPDPRACAAA